MNFNLCGKFLIKYNAETTKLVIDYNNNFLEDFFVLPNQTTENIAKVCLVSAIVGENGAGKTTFLEFLKENLADGNNGIKSDAIIALENINKNVIELYISSKIKLDIKNITKPSNLNLTIYKYYTNESKQNLESDSDNLNNFSYKRPDFHGTSFIYLSNIFDKKEEVELYGLFNLSTNYLLKNDFNFSSANNYDVEINENKYKFIEDHRSKEIHRELSFITNFKNNYQKYLNFKLPDKLILRIVSTPIIKINSDFNKSTTPNFISNLKYLIQESKLKFTNTETFIVSLFIRGIFNIYYEFYKYGNNENPLTYINIKLDFYNFEKNDIYSVIHEAIESILSETNNLPEVHMKYRSLGISLKLLTAHLSRNDSLSAEDACQFNLKNKEDQIEFFEFYDFYLKTFSFDTYLNFSWSDLSTGQKALLNLYSRLYSVSENELSRNSSNLKLSEHIIILIDEGELYLHPAWQKEILFQLLNILPIIFKSNTSELNRRSIQLILTSNSPIIISDLPSSNIVFLKKSLFQNKEIINVQDSLNDQKQTFSANIHTLFSDTFFMKNGFIGDFAEFRISEVIDLLLGDKREIEEQKAKIEKIILMIGEPIIKSKLIQMLNERMSLDLINMNQRVTQLEIEIKKLKEIQQ